MSTDLTRSRSPDATAAHDTTADLDDAHRAVGYFSHWIGNADTKVGLLTAVAAVLLGGVGQQAGAVAKLTEQPDNAELAALAVFASSLVALLVGGWHLARAVTPRTDAPEGPNRFSFPSLSANSLTSLSPARDVVAGEAWSQAQLLARIASTKFARLRIAIPAIFGAAILFALWLLGSSLLLGV
jgi:hypothetical protein